MKVKPLNSECLNQAKNIPLRLPNSQSKILGLSVKGFLSYDRTFKKQTEIATLYIIYIDADG